MRNGIYIKSSLGIFVRKALIAGINDISVAVAKLLVSNGYDVVFIAQSENEGRLIKRVPAYVYVGDPMNEDFLKEVGIDETELVLLFLSDEANLKVASIARSRGVPTVIVTVTDKENYLDKFIELGVYAIPIVDALVSKIAYYLKPSFKQLLFADDLVQAYYVVISIESPYIGSEIEDLERRCNVSIPLIIRNNKVMMKREGLRIEPNDKVLLVGKSESVVKCVERLY